MAFTPSKWGGRNTGSDYVAMMQGSTPRSKPIMLEDHGLDAFNQELRDPVDVTISEIRGGRRVDRSVRIRQADQIATTFTILFGADGPLYTPALQRARDAAGCPTDFAAKRLCAPNEDYAHAYLWPESILNPPTRVDTFIPIGETSPTAANWQAEVRASEELILWGVGAFEQADIAGTVALLAVAFVTQDCLGCSDEAPLSRIIAVGGDGTAAGAIYLSDDRFATNAALTSAIPAAHYGTSIYTDGDIALVGFADEIDVAEVGSATGGTVFSSNINDAVPSFTVDTNITEPVRGVAFFAGRYLAVGGTAAGIGLMWESEDGINWTAVVSAALSGTNALTAIAVDEENGAFYITGEGGVLLKGTESAGSVVLSDIEANLPGTPGILYAVAVLGADHVMVVGASGYGAESYDGGDTFRSVALGGVANGLAVAGTRHRTLVGTAAPAIRISDLLTDYGFSALVPELGATLTTAVRGLASDPEDINRFVAVTAGGEVVYIKPKYPNA